MGLKRYFPKGPLELVETWVFSGNRRRGDSLEVGPFSGFWVRDHLGGQHHSSVCSFRCSGGKDFGLGGFKPLRQCGVPDPPRVECRETSIALTESVSALSLVLEDIYQEMFFPEGAHRSLQVVGGVEITSHVDFTWGGASRPAIIPFPEDFFLKSRS